MRTSIRKPGQPCEHLRGAHEERPRAARDHDLLDLRRRTRGVERDRDGSREPDRQIEGEVSGSVRSHDRDPIAACDPEVPERPHRGEDVPSEVGAIPRVTPSSHHVVVRDRHPLARQAVQDLFVHRPIGAMEEAVPSRVREQVREALAPLEPVASDQPVGVVPQERSTLLEVGEQREHGIDPAPRASEATKHGLRDGREDRPWEPHAEVLERPGSNGVDQLPGRRQRVRGSGEVEGRSRRRRVARHADDRVGHMIDRNDVRAEVRAHREDPEPPRHVEAERCVDRVERRDRAALGVSDDHGGTSDRDREFVHRGSSEHLALVLASLVRTREPEPIRGWPFLDRPLPFSGHVRRRDVHEPVEPVVPVDLAGELEDVTHSLHVRGPEVVDRRVEAQVGRRMDHDVDPADQLTMNVVGHPEGGRAHVAEDRPHVPADPRDEIRHVPPRPSQHPFRCPAFGSTLGREDEDEELGGWIVQQPFGDAAPDEARSTREEDHAAHGSASYPCAARNERRSPRLRPARSRSPRYPTLRRPSW